MRRVTLFVLLSLFLCVPALWAKTTPGKAATETFSLDRNQWLARILTSRMSSRHFAPQELNDEFSRKIYDLYLRQLDPRKRFLLQSDVRELDSFRERIDDELKHTDFRLPDVGRRLLDARIREVDRLIDPILDAGFDFNLPEKLEIDAKKLQFAEDKAALRERWRLTLKMQVLDSFFDELEDKRKKEPEKYKAPDPAACPELLIEATRKVRASSHRAMQRLLQQTRQDHYDRYFDAFARANDPHSNYMPPDSKEDFDIQMSGALEGIGALLREDEGLIKVVRVMPGSPAKKQGQLQAEDTILSVAEKGREAVDISEMRIREAVKLIRGPKGSDVVLNVRKPDGGKASITITRDVVQLDEDSFAKSALLRTGKGTPVGYIRIPSFYRDFNKAVTGRNVTDDTRQLLLALKKQGIRGLILDLRNNGGGALEDAVRITGLFLPGGPVVQVKDSDGSAEVRADKDASVDYDGSLIVLVNQFSASASEILAAALQDYDRAIVIGSQHTHGKGTVQELGDLNEFRSLLPPRKISDLGALKLTIQKFYRVNGGSTQFRGVTPDLVVPSVLDHLESGEQYMDYALPWDQILPVPFNAWTGAMLNRDEVKSRGGQWVAGSPAFQKIQKESDKASARIRQTLVTVAADDMWRERQELEQARKDARAAGFVEAPDEDEDENKDSGKKLEETLARDPYVQLSLELFGNTGKTK